MTGGLGLKREEAAATANFSGSCSSCDPGGGLLSAAQAGVRPREEASAGAFDRDFSLPRVLVRF